MYVPSGTAIGIAQECTLVDATGTADSNVCAKFKFGGCGFPANDPKGLYIFAPVDTTAVIGDGSLGCHQANSSGQGPAGTAVGIFITQVGSGQPTPNGNVHLDSQIATGLHEIVEGITDSPQGSGWGCNGPTREIQDICGLGNFGGGGWLGTVGGQAYNLVIGANKYSVADTWQAGPINQCMHVAPDRSNFGKACNVPSDCPAPGGWQLNCNQGQCTIPTCFDGIQDGTETDVDCGGDCAGYALDPFFNLGIPCASGKKCAFNPDCHSAVCTAGICN